MRGISRRVSPSKASLSKAANQLLKRHRPVVKEAYNSDYFERGPIVGVSGYMNYSWMPELTIRMAHKLVTGLPIKAGQPVLDFGCAKGFLVKALRLLDVDAHGVDVSRYAIKHADADAKPFCKRIQGVRDSRFLEHGFHWLIAKDVLEHLTEDQVSCFLDRARGRVPHMFIAVPLGEGTRGKKFIISEYDRDVTHKLARSMDWWTKTFPHHGWHVDWKSHSFPGCKDNWTEHCPDGNGFFVLSAK